MIKGMTGFGSAQCFWGRMKAVVEIKSLNHRYLDINYYLPPGFGAIEEKIRQMIQQSIQRGRVTASIKITQKPAHEVMADEEAVKKYLLFAKQVGRKFRLEDDLKLSDIIKLPGVLEAKEVFMEPQEMWPALEKSFQKSLEGLEQMRKREGRSLAADVKDKLRRMSLQVKKIQARSAAVLKEQKGRMSDEEFRSFQKSSDVNEEISRLIHYLEEAGLLIKEAASAGKKLDFIAQEMQRETNTIGAKLQDKAVSSAVIALKSKIEKIREQAQNIE